MSTHSPTPSRLDKTGFRLYWRAKLAPYPAPIRAAGFTLIELSIALVIIGLIVGGVLVGQDLIKAAEIRNMVSEKEAIVTATYTFRNKYNGLPGDLKNAEQFWGSDASCPSTPSNTVAKVATCNGDGDKRIDYGWGYAETLRYWQQLANAGLWSGQYTGANAAGNTNLLDNGDEFLVGTNIPSAGFKSRAGWWVGDVVKTATGHGWYRKNYNNTLMVGVPNHNSNSLRGWQGQPFMSSANAKSLDEKLDDSNPYTGNVMVNPNVIIGGTVIHCALETEVNPTYYASLSDRLCNILFVDVF